MRISFSAAYILFDGSPADSNKLEAEVYICHHYNSKASMIDPQTMRIRASVLEKGEFRVQAQEFLGSTSSDLLSRPSEFPAFALQLAFKAAELSALRAVMVETNSEEGVRWVSSEVCIGRCLLLVALWLD